jgi:hypothetical protein
MINFKVFAIILVLASALYIRSELISSATAKQATYNQQRLAAQALSN